MSDFRLHNSSPTQPALPTPLPKSFTLRTPPGCDTWRKPPSTNDFNAPFLVHSIPFSSLRSARVTVSSEWKTKFDQGGLLLVLPPHKPTKDGEEKDWDRHNRRWIKTGIEVFEGRPNVSTVACDRWADWSLAPLPSTTSESHKATVEITREVENGEKTSTLWVHYVDLESGEKRPLREVAWAFEDDSGDCEIGVYTAKPTKDQEDPANELDVCFEDLVIDQW